MPYHLLNSFWLFPCFGAGVAAMMVFDIGILLPYLVRDLRNTGFGRIDRETSLEFRICEAQWAHEVCFLPESGAERLKLWKISSSILAFFFDW